MVIHIPTIVSDGKVDGTPIVRAWESIRGDYFLATEDKGNGCYYGLWRLPNNDAQYLEVNLREIVEQKMWPINECDLSCFSFEIDDPMVVISRYTAQQAADDGVLVFLKDYQGPEGKSVYMTSNLYASEGDEENPDAMTKTVEVGLDLLKLPDIEDEHSSQKLRQIEKGKIWVIEDGENVTFLKPEDY